MHVHVETVAIPRGPPQDTSEQVVSLDGPCLHMEQPMRPRRVGMLGCKGVSLCVHARVLHAHAYLMILFCIVHVVLLANVLAQPVVNQEAGMLCRTIERCPQQLPSHVYATT
eukprot:6162904-Amphidinium_carterae.2